MESQGTSSPSEQFLRSLKKHPAEVLFPDLSAPPAPLAIAEDGYQTSPEAIAFKHWLYWRAEMQARALGLVVGACRSPIERAMFSGILCVAGRWVDGIVYYLPDGAVISDGDTSSSVLYISPQHQVGPYTVDFHLRWRKLELIPYKQLVGGRVHDLSNIREVIAEAIVECDGHEFHERTPEQARRDRERDRALQGLGYTVLRFTGREIWQDPVGCAVQIKEGMLRRSKSKFD